MPSRNPTVRRLERSGGPLASARTGVSLHAHTYYSKEPLGFIPDCAAHLPVIGRLLSAELRRHVEGGGQPIDFRRAYWRPPLAPAAVLASERRQIHESLGLDALVSITDHDSVKAGQMLRPAAGDWLPISVEWTVPFQSAFLHIGLHHLPPGIASTVMREIAVYTQAPVERRLGELLDWIGESRDTLIVLNHPFWDLEAQGAEAHKMMLLDFVQQHRERIHALELNGMQLWENNQQTLALAQATDLAVVSGGDRHGCAPNAMLNVTRVREFAEFVEEVRRDGASEIVILPSYEHALLARRLEIAGDILRTYRRHEAGRPRWSDRICYEREPGAPKRLSSHWPDGAPWWLRVLARSVDLLTRPRCGPVWRGALRHVPEMNTWEPRHEWHSSPIRSTK